MATQSFKIHTALPVKHGGTSALVTVECVYFCETAGVTFVISLYYNDMIQSKLCI